MKFSKRGHRRKAGYGLTYRSDCGGYAVYKSYQAAGVRLPSVKWLAIVVCGDHEQVISRHRKRKRAEEACENHLERRRKNEQATQRTHRTRSR